ncbi:MAG: chromosome partitioning protein ParB [Flavobacteriales bacterium]|nr:chromosome partitioning protein ParB [Flavobacteriales bacterium]|tara:strand:- start:5423 stop:6292 length:870 start_codon:yes stop_codon:yes gene_type:complete
MRELNKKSRLGRGLSSIFNTSKNDGNEHNISNRIDIHLIKTNPFQPRTNIGKKELQELSDSIKTYGLIQPITVRQHNNEQYELISGERRLQASILAGLKTIPVFIKNIHNHQMREVALVENIQRQDLDPIEIALSLEQLINESNIKQDTLAKKIGKSRSTISNYIRLLKLDPIIQAGIRDKMISMGHAKAIINIVDQNQQLELYQNIIKYKYSVRETESIVKDNKLSGTIKGYVQKNILGTEFKIMEEELSEFFQQRIKLKISKNGKGKIEIPFQSEKKLDEIIKKLYS